MMDEPRLSGGGWQFFGGQSRLSPCGTTFFPPWRPRTSTNGALALHEYAWPTLDNEWPWYLLRHRKVYDGDPTRGWDGLPAT